MEKRWEYAQNVHALFVDFTKGYDSVDRNTLFCILRHFKIPHKLTRMVEVAIGISRMRVRVENDLSDEFEVVTGLKQGDALSPTLFNLVLEYVVRKVLMYDGGVELNGRHKVVGYADDLALLGQRKEDVASMAEILEDEGAKVGLRINRDKTEYILMKRAKNTRAAREDLKVRHTSYKGVSRFKYLGCTVTETNLRDDDIDIRVQSALRCSAALRKLLVSTLLSRKTKIRIYKMNVRMRGLDANSKRGE